MSSSTGPEDIERAIAVVQGLSRRDFLKFAAASAALGGLASMGLAAAAPSTAQAGVPDGIRFMGEAEYKVFHRLMQVTLPVEGTSLAPLADIPVMKTLDGALLGVMAPHELHGLKEGIKVFEDGPVQAYGKRFTELGDKEAAAFCDAWADSAQPMQRGLATGLKKLVSLSYWANPPTWSALGYDGPVTKRWGLRSIGNAPMPTE